MCEDSKTCTPAGTPTPSDSQVIYFIGCDMGGWHTRRTSGGDALAVCKWDGTSLSHVRDRKGRLFYPITTHKPQHAHNPGSAVAKFVSPSNTVCEDQLLDGLVSAMIAEGARIIIAIDAALAWPKAFAELVAKAPAAGHLPTFGLTKKAIENPYLYRETERFIDTAIGKTPLTAPGSYFGNNSSKAQALAAWFKSKLPCLYRPPFDNWCRICAASRNHTLIEVYPAASMHSNAFKELCWPPTEQAMKQLGKSDIADAKRCAMTAVCYAVTVGMLNQQGNQYPDIWLPNDPLTNFIYKFPPLVPDEGWIFFPK